jgi:phosphoenolpyruvate synthase/pyruvate phosphate dikinase
MPLPITITITATASDRFRAETPVGPVEADSLRELGDRLRDFLANLEDESASDLAELARLSRSATDQTTLLELARTSPPPDAWFGGD